MASAAFYVSKRLGGVGAAGLLALTLVGPASGQQAFYSAQGALTAGGGSHDFSFTLTAPVANDRTLGFSTQSDTGGFNSAGDFVIDSDFDSVLELTKPFDPVFSVISDDDGSNRDAFMSWEGVATSTPGAFLPSPLDAEPYRLRLREFNAGNIGAWSVDMVTPADSFILNGAAANGGSQLDSLKFGTDAPSATPARFEFSSGATMTIQDELGVGSTGNGTLTQSSGTITAVGFLDVGTGGIVNLNGGTLNLGNQLSSIFGTVNVDGGSLVLAGTGNLRAVSGGTLNVNSGMFDAGNADLSVDGGATAKLHFTNATIDLGLNRSHTVANNATLNTFGSFDLTDSNELTVRNGGKLNAETLRVGLNDLASFDDTQLTVTNSGSSLVTTFGTFVGDTGGAGVITVSDQATAAFGTLVIAGDAPSGTRGTVNLETGATATAGFVFIADAGTDSPGLLKLTDTDTALTQTGAAGVIVGQNPVASGGSGTGKIDIGTGSTFHTGTGTSRVDPTGTIDVNGTLNQNGNLTISGGTVGRVGAGPGVINLAADKTITVQDGGTLHYGRIDNPGLLDADDKSILVTGAGSLYDGQQAISVDGGELRATAGGRITGEFVRMQSGTFTIDGAGATLDTTGSAATQNTIGYSLDADATNAGSATLRLAGDAHATLTRPTNVGSDANFSGGSGRIIVADSARLDVGSLSIGTNLGFGRVQVSGGIGDVGRIVQSAGSFLQVGSNDPASQGRIEININGEFTTGVMPIDVFTQGTISIGQGTFNANGELNINGGLLQRFSENFGAFNLAAGKNLTVKDAGQLLFSDKLIIGDGSKLTLQGAATGSSFSLFTGNGAGQTGTALFEGQDTEFEINGFGSSNPVVPSRVGSDGGDATLTVRDQAHLRIVSPIDLAAGTAADASAALSISGGATAELASFNLAADGSMGGTGSITVSGAGTKLETRLGSQSTLNLGHATEGTATFTVENGAEYVGGDRVVFGQNIINVNATATVNVNGSRFIADAINLNGGAFNYTSGVLDFDTFTGNLAQDGGTLTPNTFDRAMVIDGDYTLSAGTVAFDIRQGFDNSISADSIDLGTLGLLEVSATVFQSLPYTVGDTFTILSSDMPIVGAFASEDILIFNDKTFDVMYNATSVVLEVVAATSVIGDYNADGFVSQADLDLVLLNWGDIILPAGWINTDQFDGVQVSQNELDGVLLNWGNGTPGMTPPAAGTLNAAAVPEPGALTAMALAGLIVRRRRAR